MATPATRGKGARHIPTYLKHGDKRQPPWIRTHVELATVYYLSIGYRHAEIAEKRCCSPTTVSTQVFYLKERAMVKTTTGLVGAWFRWHILHGTLAATERPAYCS